MPWDLPAYEVDALVRQWGVQAAQGKRKELRSLFWMTLISDTEQATLVGSQLEGVFDTQEDLFISSLSMEPSWLRRQVLDTMLAVYAPDSVQYQRLQACE